MNGSCHRCHADLLERATNLSRSDEHAFLFCPRCGAPQICLPDHLRMEQPVAAGDHTTGSVPPPRPPGSPSGRIDWHAALRCAASVAGVGALLGVASLRFTFFSLAYFCWTVGSAVIALGLYAKWRPQARMDAGVGLRIGSLTGLLMIVFLAIAFTVTGLVVRFGTHGMAGFDGQLKQEMSLVEQQMKLSITQEQRPPEVQEKVLGFVAFLNTPEARTGMMLAGVGLQAVFILLVATGGGGFAGMLRRPGSLSRDLREGK